MIYVIAYDRPMGLIRVHEEFLGQIRRLGNRWIAPMDQLWLVDTDLTSEQIFRLLQPFMTAPGDRLIITALSTTYLYGWLPQEAWDWLRQTPGFSSLVSLTPPGAD